ncbi:MAG TPA: zinc ribbon domain-containing protein [Nevskiaceae bacterium]|nr:zinc ribbon domain-containing protein [Nevskiaceae bacterium]
MLRQRCQFEGPMPIYEYVCRACGKESEIIQKISDPPEKKCPLCGKRQLQKLVSAAGFRLKGGGWYETDFKSGDKKKNVAGETKPEDSKSEPAKADNKPAEKTPKSDKSEKSDKSDKSDKSEKKNKPADKPSKKAAA